MITTTYDPATHVLVPLVPTKEMCVASDVYVGGNPITNGGPKFVVTPEESRAIYIDMIEAAPAAPAQPVPAFYVPGMQAALASETTEMPVGLSRDEQRNFIIKAAQPVPESLDLASIISGALFDFMGMLTSQTEETHLSGHHDANIAVERIQQFAAKRGLTLTEANVNHWHNWLGKPEPETSTESTHAQDVYKNGEEIDTLRRDALRYRLLRERTHSHEVAYRDFENGFQGSFRQASGTELDQYIDKALQAKGEAKP